MSRQVKLDKIVFSSSAPFVLIAGPCVIEDHKTVDHIAGQLKRITQKLKIPFVFKASYDKANRTSVDSFRGVGIQKGLDILSQVKTKWNVPVTSDVHTVEEAEEAEKVLDILQIPAFLCRQTDLLVAAGKTKKVINIKKGQFLSPHDMTHAINKVEYGGSKKILVTERGTSFGYNTLVSDFRSLAILDALGCPVVFDATHSVQQPGGLGKSSGGQSEYVPLLARCGIAAGCSAIFMEVHTNPAKARSDGPNMLPLSKVEKVLKELKAIDKVVKGY